MPYILTQSQIDQLTILNNNGDYAGMYQAIYDLTANPDANGNPIEDADIRAWFEAAAQANAGVGYPADLIRDYTEVQVLIRTGQTVTVEHMDQASDALASSIFDTYILGLGRLPTLAEIRVTDSQAIVDSLNGNSYNVDLPVWSGNLLFVGLGDTTALEENLIPAGSDDAYDIFAAVHAMQSVGIWTLGGNFLSSLGTLASNLPSISSATASIEAFVDDIYGDWLPAIGTSIVTVGQQGNYGDVIDVGSSTSNDIIHASYGGDFLIGSDGNDLLDGGDGLDAVSFERTSVENENRSITLSLHSGSGVSGFSGVAQWDGTSDQTALFNVEEVSLGNGSDTLIVESLTGILSIDALANVGGDGDLIDATNANDRVTVNLETGTLTLSGYSPISATNFENVIGSSSADQITGDGEDNVIDGGAGNDVIDGGSSGSEDETNHDTISGGAGDDVIEGGAGTDSLMGGSGNDTITDSEDGATMFGGSGNDSISVTGDEAIMYGGSGNDTLDASQATGSVILSGGSGDDTLRGNGQSVLQGGSGADTFYIQSGDVITDVEAQDTLYFEGQNISAFGGGGSGVLVGVQTGPQQPGTIVTTGFSSDPLATSASIAIALEVNNQALPDDFNGTFQGISYTAYVYVNPTQSEDYPEEFYSLGHHGAYIFDLSQADLVISDFRLGDFGIMPNGIAHNNVAVMHNTFDVAGQFTHDGVDYHLGLGGEFSHGPGRSLSEEELAAEAAFEELTEGAEDAPLFPENGSTPPPTGTSGDDRLGSPASVVSASSAATGDEVYDGGAGNDIIQGNDGSDTLIGGDGDDTIIGGTLAFDHVVPDDPSGQDDVGLAAVDANGDGLIDVEEAEILEPFMQGITLLFDEFDTTEDGYWDDQEFSVVVDVGNLPYPFNPDAEPGGDDGTPPPVGRIASSSQSSSNPLPADTGDQIHGGNGDDLVYGGDGDDTISGDAGNDRVFGEADNDTLTGGDGHDQLDGGDGSDLVSGDEGNDSIEGGTGNDTLNGNAGEDDIEGGEGDDLINGGLGNDTLNGKDGDDILEGAAGRDSLFGAEGDDLLEGQGGDDTLSGGMGADVIVGGSGDDALNGGEGNDIYEYFAGDGNDTILELNGGGSDRLVFVDIASTEVSLSRVNGDLLITLPDGSVVTVDRQYTSISGRIEYLEFSDGVTTTIGDLDLDIIIQGTPDDDLLDGSRFEDEIIQGLAGNDTLASDGGDDSLYGGDGNDILSSTDDWELLDGGNGDDTLIGSQGWDTYIGGDGVDTLDLSYSALNFSIDLEAGTLQFPNSSQDPPAEMATGIENVIGGSGNNTIVGSAGSNALDGGTGSDTLTGAGGNDLFRFNTGDGNDTVTDFEVGPDQIEIDGMILDPTNVPTGVSIVQQGQDVEINYGSGDMVTLQNTNLSDWIASFGPIVSGTSGDDTVTGTNDSELITAGAGNDTINAASGDDTISYHSGDDVILGYNENHGTDTLDLSQYASDEVSFRVGGLDIFIDTPDGTIELDQQVRYDTGHTRSNIEAILFSDGSLDEAGIRDRATDDQATDGDDAITGTGHSDTIPGSEGNDTITAGAGDDTITYASGDDVILGYNSNHGTDTLDLSQYTSDQVSFTVSGLDVLITTPDGQITLQRQVQYDLGHNRSNIENIVFADGALDEAGIRDRAVADQTSTGDDLIQGSSYSDTISAGSGDDSISAGGGDDTIVYMSGNDVIYGYNSNHGTDTLDLSQYASDEVSFTISGLDVVIATPDGQITLHRQIQYDVGHHRSNIESITFSDGTLDDAGIRDRAVNDIATTGDDLLVGTNYDDIIVGEEGNDTLTGNNGADVFEFFLNDGMDVITDFTDGSDMIRFAGGHAGFAALTITQVGDDAVINYGGTSSIALTGVLASTLSEEDFVFV